MAYGCLIISQDYVRARKNRALAISGSTVFYLKRLHNLDYQMGISPGRGA